MAVKTSASRPELRRIKIRIAGAVQGVGFRPFVYRLATALNLTGWVSNSPQGVIIEAEGNPKAIQELLDRLPSESPPHSSITALESTVCEAAGYSTFRIAESNGHGDRNTLVLPDIAPCADCRREIFDPTNRRFRYPFTNCTHCGPRYSIIESLPYDRVNTTMREFDMCSDCRAEYENPLDRRFHAQPNACPVCGPRLEYWATDRSIVAADHDALFSAARDIRDGAIVAVKGVGGFHLLADAYCDAAIRRLRLRKSREEKPLAVMFPSLASVEACCLMCDQERHLLLSPQAPIVLLRRSPQHVDTHRALAPSVAPDNPYVGALLADSPLHHLLMAELGSPVVATSGNRSNEPICIGERDALARLAAIADMFLVHNRPIANQGDDSIVRVLLNREMVLRRARGYAPLPVQIGHSLPPVLGAGGHLKNTVALAVGNNVFISQHIGDLDTEAGVVAHRRTAVGMQRLFDFRPDAVACDAHPDYASTLWANQQGLPVMTVQHHHAHILACMAEHGLTGPVLGMAWDGTGYGADGTVWGGEFLRVSSGSYERLAHLRTFRMPGGEQAIREPRRAAFGLLHEIFGRRAIDMDWCPTMRAFSIQERRVLEQALSRRINAPVTSSVGRLFDAVASITGVCQRGGFEGKAAMSMEFAAARIESNEAYEVDIRLGADPLIVDWEPMVRGILSDVSKGDAIAVISARFHNSLVRIAVSVARRLEATRVVLAGGCFQNGYLLKRIVGALAEAGIEAFWSRQVPPNDGGISLGQVMAAAGMLKSREE
jgi:hydrogenase maturation protein HypF